MNPDALNELKSDRRFQEAMRKQWIERQLRNFLCKHCKKNERAPGSSRCQICTDAYRALQTKPI